MMLCCVLSGASYFAGRAKGLGMGGWGCLRGVYGAPSPGSGCGAGGWSTTARRAQR